MDLFKLPFLFLLLTGYALCNENTKGICPDPDEDTLIESFIFDSESHITKKMFESCNQLKSISLVYADSETHKIDADAFKNLNNLKKFGLQGYKIPHVKKGFFKLTPFIEEIYIDYADIEEIDSDAFEDFRDLKVIYIAFNKKWKHLPENLFKNLTKLTLIDLRHNNLEGLTWEEFKGLTNVKTLNLRFNNVSSFDAEKISKFMPNLKSIGIEGNPIGCKSSRTFVEELKKKLNLHRLYYDVTCQEDH